MEDLAVFTALNHSGSFGKNFVELKKNKYVIYRSVRMVKNSVLKISIFKTSVTLVHLTDLPAGK